MRAAVAAVIAAVALVAAACGAPATEGVQPLDGNGRESATSAPASPHPQAATPPAPAPSPDGAPVPGTGVPAGSPTSGDTDRDTDGTAAARTVQDVLDRYDRVVTGLHADPAAFLRPDDPLLAEWGATVPAGAVLGDDVRSQVLERLRRGEAIPVRRGERSYVHHVVAVSAASAGRITFSWCGWSPGVVRNVATGAVTDDAVSHGVGTGTVETTAGTWVLSSLDESSYDVLPANSTDPCPTSGVAS